MFRPTDTTAGTQQLTVGGTAPAVQTRYSEYPITTTARSEGSSDGNLGLFTIMEAACNERSLATYVEADMRRIEELVRSGLEVFCGGLLGAVVFAKLAVLFIWMSVRHPFSDSVIDYDRKTVRLIGDG